MKSIKQHEDPNRDAKMVKFYLGYEQFQDRTKRHVLPVSINGYRRELEFGKEHEVPEPYLKLIENAKMSYVRNSPLDKYEHAVGGQGRPQSEILQNASEVVAVPMYDVVRR